MTPAPFFSELAPLAKDSVLGRIVTQKIEDVRTRSEKTPLSHWTSQVEASDRNFAAALKSPKLALIAEVKKRSPSQGEIRPDLKVSQVADIYNRYAAAISVVADAPFFGGSLELLSEVRSQVQCPILLKDFIVSAYQIYEGRAHGADGVLLMASVLSTQALEALIRVARELGMEPLVEVHDRKELEAVQTISARIIGINNRDLTTLKIDRNNFSQLASHIDDSQTIVCESGLTDRAHIDAVRDQADAVLIGTHFMAAGDIEAEIRNLGW